MSGLLSGLTNFKIILMQIDVIKFLTNHIVECNLYTGDRCVKISMMKADYEALIRDGFFIRDGKAPDSAGVLNTTLEHLRIRYSNGNPELF